MMKVRVLSLALMVKVFGRGGGVLRRFLCSIEEEEEKGAGTFLLLRASMRRISMVVLAGPWRI